MLSSKMADAGVSISQENDNERGFWNKWYERSNGKEPWTKNVVNRYLIKYQARLLGGNCQKKVFIPLCGRSLEIKWFYDLGHEVVGVDGSEVAVRCFFETHAKEHSIVEVEDFRLFKSVDGRLRIYCGDFFAFKSTAENNFDAVWDRAAFGSINPVLRSKYAHVLLQNGLLNDNCRCLVEGFQYELSEHNGPPFVLTMSDVACFIGPRFDVELLENYPLLITENNEGHLKSKNGESLKITSNLYLLTGKN